MKNWTALTNPITGTIEYYSNQLPEIGDNIAFPIEYITWAALTPGSRFNINGLFFMVISVDYDFQLYHCKRIKKG